VLLARLLTRCVSVPSDEPELPAQSDAQREDDCDSDQRQGSGESEPKQDQDAERTGDYRPSLFKRSLTVSEVYVPTGRVHRRSSS